MFGSHLSIAGGLHNALIAAHQFGMDCVQVFTQNQRQWKNRRLTDHAIELWRCHRFGTDLAEVVSHGSYLVNLASPNQALRRRSISAVRAELKRCEALGVRLLVVHPGAHMGAGEPAGLRRVIRALDRLAGELPGNETVICLETTAGQGTALGWRLEQLGGIIEGVANPDRLGVCLDTAHMFAAGYDLSSAAGAGAVLGQCEATIGLERVRVVHFNDSKTPRGSRVDRHEHIGHGCIPLCAFRALVNHPHLATVAKILETPKETAPDGRPWDLVNLEALRRLSRGRRRSRT